VTAAPPTQWRPSRTRTLLPARARYAALTRPLWPPPTTTTSYEFELVTLPVVLRSGALPLLALIDSCPLALGVEEGKGGDARERLLAAVLDRDLHVDLRARLRPGRLDVSERDVLLEER